MIFYTDGSAHPNPGPGGYGIVGVEDDKIIYARTVQYENTTNNEMELKAILYTMLFYGSKTTPPIVYSDSAYCVNALNNWIFNWVQKGWRKGDNKAPENLQLFKAYYEWYQKGYRIDLRKIKGHAGEKYNELADKLATGKISEEEVLKGE